MSNEQGPGSLVATQFVDFRPCATRQEHRVPGHTVTTDSSIDGTNHACSGVGERRRHTVDELSGNSGLITKKNRGRLGARTRPAQTGAQRRALARSVVGVYLDPNAGWTVDRRADLFGAVTEDEDDLVEAGRSGRIHDVLQQRAILQRQ